MVEHDGNVYSCDHYGYQDHQLGTVNSDKLATMASLTRTNSVWHQQI